MYSISFEIETFWRNPITTTTCFFFSSHRLDTIDGTATAGEDYVKLSEEFKMERGQLEKRITIHVIDDNQWEPDETFFVKLSLPEGEEARAKLGSKTIALVTIINDDGKRRVLLREENYRRSLF